MLKSFQKVAARHFEIDRRMVARWVVKRKEIYAQTTKKHGKENKRLPGGGRKPLSSDVESLVLKWVLDRRLQGLRVSWTLIRKKALILFKEMGDTSESEFSASKECK